LLLFPPVSLAPIKLISWDTIVIDAIVLSLTPELYQITEPGKFKPSAHGALLNQNKEARCYNSTVSKKNPTKKELLKG
jgi:hypothetical protein